MTDETDFYKRMLITYCRDNIAFYEEGNRRSELNPYILNFRISQIENGKVVNSNTADWLMTFSHSMEEKDPQFSAYLKELAETLPRR